VAFSVYLYSLPPSITLEDAGELAVAADYLGVPHPPGYPIWTFLAWFFQWIFHSVRYQGYPNPAWAIALMSAFFGALACGLVAVCIRKLCTIPAGASEVESKPLIPELKAEILGAGIGLGLCSLILVTGSFGNILLNVFIFCFIVLITLQSLRNPEKCFSWQPAFPSSGTLGHGLLGSLVAILSWITAWYWLITPEFGLLFPIAFVGTLGLVLLSAIFRYLLQKAFQKESLASDIKGSGMDVILAIAGGLLLAFTPMMWSQSVIVEVYTLNAFFLSCLLVLTLWYIQNPQDRTLYLTAFLFALGLTNHQSLLFLLFFLIAGLAAAQNKRLLKDGLCLLTLGAIGLCLVKAKQYHDLGDSDANRFFLLLTIPFTLYFIGLLFTGGGLFKSWKQLGILLLLGLLGLSFHLYMPLASEQNPPMNWGNARTKEGFMHMLTRGQYAKFSVADNFKQIIETVSTPADPEDQSDGERARSYVRRTLFLRMLGSYFYGPDWKYSIANQFSWQFPLGEDDPTQAPPEEKAIPLALLGLIPLLCFSVFPKASRGWFISSMVALFFVSVVFLTIQWPELNHNDLWVKRVQYVQAHVLYAIWMALGTWVLLLIAYAWIPKKVVLSVGSALVCLVYISFPLHKNATDPKHLEQLGSSNLRGHDYGWQYGFYMLKGANGILLDELSHHENPDCLLNDWAMEYLSDREFPDRIAVELLLTAADKRIPLSQFKKEFLRPLDLSEAETRLALQATTMAAFRSLSPEEQTAQLVHLHRPLPDWDYPQEMDQNGILFGATDPGRFVPTYMIFSAECRTDLYIITQTALADPTYQTVTRDLYGDEIFVPDLVDGNQAFLDYGNDLRLFHPEAFYELMSSGDTLSISGVSQVNEINSYLSRQIFNRNQARHSFYMEEAMQMDWMVRHQRPHGLVFKLEIEDVDLDRKDIVKDFAFWDWYEEHLLETWKEDKPTRNRFQRDLPVRKSFSKLRMAQAWNYFERGHWRDAELAMEQAQRLYPANPEAAFRAGDMYMRMGQFEKAEKALSDFEKHDPTNRQLVNFRSSLEQLKELDVLREELEQDYAVQITGNTALQLLQIYSQFKMEAKAKQMADVLLNLPNLSVDFYIHLAGFMQQEKNRVYYRKAVEKWAEKDSQDARPEIDLGVIALSEERYTDMALHLVRAVQLDPENTRAQLASDPRFVDIHHWQQFQRLLKPSP